MEQQPSYLSELNDSQQKAVLHTDGPSLVIAGAGSGKTRVLTYKIAYLLSLGIKPWEIMALTFTNKAAAEMKERIARLVGDSNARYLRMGTFHSVFSQILRAEAAHIGYSSNFTIYDESDSRSLCKAIIKELKLDDKTYKPADVHCRISNAKNQLITASKYAGMTSLLTRDATMRLPDLHKIFSLYEERCKASNAMDFDDLLLNTYLLFKRNEDIRMKYATGFKYFLVDEYQDTNSAQQKIIYQLASEHKRVCVVGDDAQSIYGFRGANIDNILDFQKQYANASLFKLEQNYRSTQNIVNAANSLIRKNQRQIHKDVFSRNSEGDKLQMQQLSSDREEALCITRDIQAKIREEGFSYSDFAILYRTNYQSRTFEEQFMKSGIPYRIQGGMSFYQRKEIKDLIAYFRLVCNPSDEEAFKRIINYPARGIGDTTLGRISLAAHDAHISLWDAICDPEAVGISVNKGIQTKLAGFRNMISDFAAKLTTTDAYSLGKEIAKMSGISADLYSSTDPEYLSRQENLEEFLSSMYEFVETAREEGNPTGLTDFLHDVALLSDREDTETDVPKICLMTIHSSKGLEFPCVYIVGMEENIFPSPMCTESMRELEEERRLLYVAITRAEKHCMLTYAKMRYRYGKMEFDSPSRFLRDIDPRFISVRGGASSADYGSGTKRRSLFGSFSDSGESSHHSRPATPASPLPSSNLRSMSSAMRSTPAPSSTPSGDYVTGLEVGATVEHDRFGRGTVIKVEGTGPNCKATIAFVNAGEKQLLLKFAKLHIV